MQTNFQRFYKMSLRKNFLPRKSPDYLACAAVMIYMPLYTYLWITHIMPAIHGSDGFWYIFQIVLAVFVVQNIFLNYFASVLTDTSFVRDSQSITLIAEEEEEDWHYCEECKRSAPPRVWHCYACGTCILKRDHHCVFTGCCIGHNNQRYFLIFVVYLSLASIYAFIYHSIYLWVVNGDTFVKFITPFKFICPPLYFYHGTFWENIMLFLYIYNLCFLSYPLAYLFRYVPTMLRGGVAYERHVKTPLYDQGLTQNFKNIFGERMHLVWLSPFIRSNLPHNGIRWHAMMKEI